jgi:sugar (glycoside-pentoside-hexuronide) transporter
MAKNADFLTSKKERSAYAGWFVGQNIIYFMVISYLAIFLTDVVMLAGGAVALLFLIARVWDAINDPILGALVDKTQPKKGKFKPWINAVTIVMPIATIFLFWNFNGTEGFNLAYAYISYIIWGMLYTISDVPIFALATTMTDHPQERVTIMSLGCLAAGLASIIIGLLAPQLISNLGYQTSIIILMVISLVIMLPLRFLVKERVVYQRSGIVTLKSMVSAVFKNKYLLIFYGSFIAITMTMTSMTIAPYFAKWNLGDIGLQTVIMGSLVPVMLLLPILTPWLVKKFGKRKIFIWGIGSSIIFSIVQFLVGYNNLGLFLLFNFLKSVGMFAPMLMMGIFTADCVEYGAYTNGERNEGITFSVQTFSTKLGSAISAALSLWIIGAFGYDGSAVAQTDSALEGIWITTSLIPIAGLIVAFILFTWKYDLTEDRVQQMIDGLATNRQISEN